MDINISLAGGTKTLGYSMGDCSMETLVFTKETTCGWLNLNDNRGEKKLTITVGPSETGRSCKITPTYKGTECKEKVINVIQGGPTPPTPTQCNCNITVGTNSITLGSDIGSTAETTYTYDCESSPRIEKEEGALWLEINATTTSPGTISFKATAYNVHQSRSANVYIKDSDGNVCKTISVTQSGGSYEKRNITLQLGVIPSGVNTYVIKGDVSTLTQGQLATSGSGESITEGNVIGAKYITGSGADCRRITCDITAHSNEPKENENWKTDDIDVDSTYSVFFIYTSSHTPQFERKGTFNIQRGFCTDGCENIEIEVQQN